MKSPFIRTLFAVTILGVFMMSCGSLPPPDPLKPSYSPIALEPGLSSGQYQPKVDSFLVILDASSSMNEPYESPHKFTLAKQFLHDMYQAISGVDVNGAQRSYGHDRRIADSNTILNVGMSVFETSVFTEALDTLKYAGGTSPMEEAIAAGTQDLSNQSGEIATVIVSDWKELKDAAVGAAREMKQQYGDRLCIYTVMVGDDAEGRELSEEVAQAGKCGFSTNVSSIANRKGMADYVKRVFLSEASDSDGDGVYNEADRCPGTPRGTSVDSRGCPLDSDGDGVADRSDKCPNTPAGAAVDDKGCPLDSDGDGVFDYKDKCPDTPEGTEVDAKGCAKPVATKSAVITEEGTWLYKNITFATNSARLEATSFPVLDEIADRLKREPSLEVEIQGHTDSTGAHAYNVNLSKRRADAVREYLIKKGVSSKQMVTRGYGPDRPLASNATATGRSENRRVELKPID